MKPIHTYFLLFVLLLTEVGSLYGQRNIGNLVVRNKYKGDQYFLDLYYEQAITYYQLALKKDINKDQLRLKIGDSYRLLHDYQSAESWYSQVMETNPEEPKPIYKYQYADMLLATGKQEEARKWYEAYKTAVPEDTRTENKIRGIDQFPIYFLDSTVTQVEPLPINTTYSEVAPIPYKGGLIFLSARDHNSLVDQDYLRKEDLYDVYYVSKDSATGWRDVHLFDKVINTPYHEGPIAFYNGEDKLLLTRSNYFNKRQTASTDGQTKLQLYTAIKTGDLWANIQPFELNDPSYSLAHPALNATNDTLYFVSDMPGGMGGTDIYVSTYTDRWSDPINLGATINTEGDELFPSYISDRLYFSSNGHDGLGGLDVYKAVLQEGKVQFVVNLGSPVNSNMDDFGYSIDPDTKTGYFTSNRMGGTGSDDLYTLRQTAQILNGIAIQSQDRSPIPGVEISIIEEGVVIASTITANDGSFKFFLPLSSDFKLSAIKEEHTLKTDISLTSKGNNVDIDTLMIEMRKHDLFAQGLVYDHETEQTIHNVTVTIKNDSTGETESVSTRTDGFYNFVIEPGNSYTIIAERERFVPDSLQINTYSFNKGIITNDFVIEEEFIDKETVFFEYNEFALLPESTQTLEKVMDVIRRFPNDYIVIGAHADARGTYEYNLDLSEKRAKSVVDYLVSRGAKRDKIIARGFGEGLIINRCSDGVNCREEEHSQNRRAEVKVEESPPEEEFYDQEQR